MLVEESHRHGGVAVNRGYRAPPEDRYIQLQCELVVIEALRGAGCSAAAGLLTAIVL